MTLTNDYTIKNISDAWKLGNSNPISFLVNDEVVSILDQYNRAIDLGAEATARFLNSGTGNEFMDGFLRDLNGAPATMDRYEVAMKNATAQQKAFSISTIATKASVIALNAAVSLGLSMVLTSLIKTISEVIQAEENMKSSAKELGAELSNNISTIDNYKNKIEELKGVLGDSSSSFDDVAQARINLMKIQDELIDKFGTEKGVIEDITEAIYGQTNALDDLSRDSYYKAKNEFNEKTTGEKFIDGLNQFLSFGYVDEDKTTSKMDKMVGQMESSLYHLKTTGNEVLDELIAKSYGLNIYDDMYGDDQHFLIMGSLDDIQEKLRGIQELSQDFDVSTSFENSLAEISNEVDSLLNSYQNLYNQYVLYEKILINNPDNQYDEQFNLINKAKEEYNNALKSGDTDAIQKASDNFAQTLSSAIDLAMNNQDYDVADYFEDMYPEMQQLFGEWKFKLDFEPNTKGIQDKVSNSLDVLEGFSSEDILNFNPNVGTDEQISAYGELNNVAEEYGLTLQQLVNLLLEMGLVSSESYQNLVDKFGQDAVDNLTPEDLQIALTISTEEANKAIEEEKKKVETELQSLSKDGNVDLTIRPVVDSSAMQAAGWDVEDGSIATTFTQGEFIWQGDEENGQYVYVHYTPILPDGTVLTPEELTDYLYGTLEGSEDILGSDDKGLVLKVDTDFNIPEEDIEKLQNGEGSTKAIDDFIQKTGEWDDKVHSVQEQYYDTGEGIGYVETALDGLIAKHSEFGKGEEAVFSDIFSLKNVEGELNNLGKISESIDAIQKAYKTLNDAIDEYNENGSFSIDTLQSVIELGDDWLDYLVDEKGNLQLDKESLQQLTQSRLEDLRVQTINNLIDNVSKIKTDADANKYLASTNYALAESYSDVAKEALKTAEAQMQAAVAAKTLTQANMDAAMSKATADIVKINKLFNNVDVTSVSSLSGGSKSGNSKSTQKEYKEVFDFFERRIDILNNSLDLLKSNLENVNGSFAKNQLIDAQSSIYQEEIKNYTDALNMYQQKANEVLATLPDDIAEKIKNGSISLTTFMGESSEAVVDAMKDYEGWSDKIADCSQKLAELKETLRDLELEKFNNIIEDFTNQFDLRQTGINNIDKQIALFEESGMLIGKSFYQAQREQASKQLDILKEQQKTMANQLSSALSSGNIEAGTDEWIEMVSELQNVEGSILDCKKAIEEFDNAILDLHWQVFERIQDQFSNLDSELDNLIGLLDDIDVADTSGNWTTDSITKLGLLTQQYELAQYNVAEYNKAIEELKEQYANGEYSAIEYSDKLAELSDGMWENVNAVEAVKDAIMDLHETRVDKEIEGIEEEIEAYNELIQAKIDELDAEKELNDYRNSISQKSKSITDLERQIAAMSNDTTAATVAQRKKLEEQLAEAKKELEDAEYDHSIQSQKDALNKQYEDYEKTRNDEIEALRDSLNNQEKLIADSFETVKQNASTIGQQISNIAKQHGVQVSNSLTSSWQAGENAIASYGSVLSSKSSAFISNIMGVENEVWALQNQADNTAVSLAYMFSTQADNLVNELAESYYAEGNLLNMTNALQSSLVNALERGYDISGITTALKGIENAANSAGAAIDLFNSKSLSDKSDNRWKVVDSKGNTLSETSLSYNEAADWLKNYEKKNPKKKGSLDIMHYAKGTRNSKGNLIVKDEQGYELVLPKLASGKYAIENEGSQILTKVETDNIFDWAKFNPDMFIPQFANNFATPISHIASKNVNNVAPSVNVGNLITVQGNVDSSNIKQMEIIANKAVNNLVDKMYNGKKYGSY